MKEILQTKIFKGVARRIMPLAVVMLLPLGACAQRLSVSAGTVDVGKTGYEVPVTATFELRNKGLKHLVIQDVKADCGCMKVDFPKKSIGPGEKFSISLTYDAGMLGHFAKQAVVYSNGSKSPVCLMMKGVVLAELKDYSKTYPYAFGELLADTDNVEFDDVNMGDHPEAEINILNNGEVPMTPNVLHLPSYLTALATPETLLPGHAGKITLTLNSNNIHSFGLTQTSVYLAHELGEKVSNGNEMPVSVVLLPKAVIAESNAPMLQLSADSLELGMVNGKMRKNGTIVLTNKGESVLNISSLQMFTGGMKVTLGKRELRPMQSTKLKIKADRAKLLRARAKPRVLMITNDPDHSKVVITINVR